MNLFTYLLAKNDKTSIVHKGDLFSYLLGKNAKGEPKKANGYDIHITDVTKVKINELLMSKESTQYTTTGKQLFDINGTINAGILDKYNNGLKITNDGSYRFLNISLPKTLPAGTYKLTYDIVDYTISSLYNATVEVRSGSTNRATVHLNSNGENSFTIADSADRLYFYIPASQESGAYVTLDNVMVSVDGGEYEKYTGGEPSPNTDYPQEINTVTGDVGITITDGTTTRNYTIPLGNNEIAGIGDYKDELIIDSNGHCWLNKKTAKINSYNGETITTDYMSTTGSLTTGATVYYVLDTPQLIDLNYDVDIRLFKGNNIITNSENMYMEIKYY